MDSSEPSSTAERLELVRLENLERCFRSLGDGAARTVSDVAAATGLSRPTVTDRLRDLIEMSFVVERERVIRRGQSTGRPASRFALSPEAGFVIGVELGKHQVRVLVADMAATVRARHVFAADFREPASARLETLRAHVAEVRAANAHLGPLRGIGAAVPGTLTACGVLARSPILAEWAGADVAAIFDAAFDVPVVVKNDLNAAALAEHRHGCVPGASDLVLALVWHQVSAGVVINGAVHTGKRSLAGELSQLASSAHPDMLDRWPSMPEFLDTVAAAERGQAQARIDVERFARAAGEQIAALLVAIDPDAVVLYGPAVAHPLVTEAVSAAIEKAIDPPAGIPVVTSSLGEDAAVTGVAIATLEDVRRRHFGGAAAPVFRLREAVR